jgi:hypothetical protein
MLLTAAKPTTASRPICAEASWPNSVGSMLRSSPSLAAAIEFEN